MAGALEDEGARVVNSPCSHYVIKISTGQRVYCEQGDAGHEGTCSGDRSQDEYDRLVRLAESSNEVPVDELLKPHRATIQLEWYPSASIGEVVAIHELLNGMCGGLMEILQSWGVVDPSLAMEFETDERYDGDESSGRGDLPSMPR